MVCKIPHTQESLRRMDAYEGCDKGYYIRKRISVRILDSAVVDGGEMDESSTTTNDSSVMAAWIYMKNVGSPEDDRLVKKKEGFLSHYSLSIHDERYRPIQHILVKQQAYLKHTASTWGLASEAPVFNDAAS